jgi:adenylate cyclase
MAALIIRSRIDSREVELGEHTWIGRHDKNTITLADPMISSEHCLIYRDGRRGYVVKDLKSRNGTLVNGERVQTEAVLRDGDEIRLGSTSCVFRSAESAAGSMVEVRGETSQTHIHTSISPLHEKQFLPEKKIRSNTSLRADYEKLRVTHELQRDIGLHENLDVILNRILDRTFEFLHYDRGVILVADASGRLQPRAYRTRKGGGKFIISSTIINHVLSEKKGIISTDASVEIIPFFSLST